MPLPAGLGSTILNGNMRTLRHGKGQQSPVLAFRHWSSLFELKDSWGPVVHFAVMSHPMSVPRTY